MSSFWRIKFPLFGLMVSVVGFAIFQSDISGVKHKSGPQIIFSDCGSPFACNTKTIDRIPAQSTKKVVDDIIKNCPKKDKDWPQLVKDVIAQLASPKEVLSAQLGFETCLKKRKSDFGFKCTEKVRDLSRAFASNRDLDVVKTEVAVKHFSLPSAFRSWSFQNSWKDATTSQKVLNAEFKRLVSGLPEGTKVLQFDSAVAKGAKVGRVRSFTTYIPGDEADLKVHFHSWGPYLILRIVKKEDGKVLERPRFEFFQDNKGEGARHKSGRCVSCHRGNEPVILPVDGSTISHTEGFGGEELRQWFNENRTIYGDVSNLSFDHLGPAIGPKEAPWRTPRFIDQCTSGIEPSLNDREKAIVTQSMNCVGCHREEGLGDIHLQYPTAVDPFDLEIFDHTVLTGHMPSKSKFPLSPPMREGLLKCLKFEYFGGFGDSQYSKGNPKPGVLAKSLLPPDCDASLLPVLTDRFGAPIRTQFKKETIGVER